MIKMKLILRVPILTSVIACFSAVIVHSQTVRKLHDRAILVDTHNDCLTSLTLKGKDIATRIETGHSDLYRWKKGGLDVQFFSIWTDKTARNKEVFYRDAVEEIDSLHHIILRKPDRMNFVTN